MNLIKVFLMAVIIALPASVYGVATDIKLDSKAESMKKAGVPTVVFPHAKHEKLYKCADCHPKIFKEKHGENDISMKKNMEGNFCGAAECHNSPQAFPLFECHKCHTGGAAK